MGHSMNKVANVLLIVEGEKTELRFFNQFAKVYDLNLDICCLSTNIYLLYKKMKELDFNCDVKDVLKELTPKYKDLLSKKFAYTYLIFDCDVQHREEYEKRNKIEEVILTNADRLEEMVKYFTDETDPSIGKLYVNYPMMESYRDCNSSFDVDYSDNYVSIDDICHYKQLVGNKKFASFRIDEYKAEEFESLLRMNVYKLNKICNNCWGYLSYNDYMNLSNSLKVLTTQRELIYNLRQVAVLNTSLFLIADYFGNENLFFDKINDKRN